MKNVVVLGKGTLAIRICEWFHHSPQFQLSAVVPVIPEPVWTESLLRWTVTKGIPCVESGRYRDISEKLPDLRIDLAFSVFYDKIIRPDFIGKCGNILNLHNGPLPKYRGVSPINWALKNEEREHGVTIHAITEGIDGGPIYSQVKFSTYPEFDEVMDVYSRALEFGWTLFQQTIPLIDRITPTKQSEEDATYYSKKEDALLGERRFFTKEQSLEKIKEI